MDKHNRMSLDTKDYFVKQIRYLSKGVVIVAPAKCQLVEAFSFYMIHIDDRCVSVFSVPGELESGMVGPDMVDYSWLSEGEEELSRQASSYITDNTEDSLAFDNRVGGLNLCVQNFQLCYFITV